MATIQDFRNGISGIHVENPDIAIQITDDPAVPEESVLLVDYPAADADPAGRDIWCDAADRDWSAGTAILFRARPAAPLRISVSFFDRNRVAYTTWVNLKGDEWQTVQIRFDEIQPNPYFQLPGADTDAPIDVSEVERLGFAPQTPEAGRLMVGKFIVVD